MTGRSLSKWERVYIDGYDLSGYGRSIGPLGVEYALADLTAPMGDTVKGFLFGAPSISLGTFNGVMQSTTDSGIEISAIQTAGVSRDVMVAIGDRAAPVAGNPVFVCKGTHSGLQIAEDGGAIVLNATFGDWDASDQPGYGNPWGILLHPLGAETAVNAADGIDTGYTQTIGGQMAYQVTAGDLAGTLKAQTSATAGGAFADITGATVTLADSDPTAGLCTVTTASAVLRYVRWQITITGGTTGTFALAWLPNRVGATAL